ncbi:hypothetical protein SAMN02745746_01648 [Pseudogulbenkiania subflava DSM 22618]|uniref:Membrane transporter protein n=1 Tax=Pseudogulbenkiania subflava DSM 22618 TaxID=1123014 RepID=A0A1Y6BSS4_9NEIS|nr:hypothetical protein SAMN02745746_01648 [Pseudogulbenkiania subflava DSM 22618]
MFNPLPSVPSATLLGTNKVTTACGTSFATRSFIGRVSIPWSLALPAAVSAFAMVFFGATGKVLYATAAPMAVSNMLGAVTGTYVAMKRGTHFIRGPFLCLLVILIIKFDSHTTKSPSRITGTMAFGFMARNSGASVERNPEPHCSYS